MLGRVGAALPWWVDEGDISQTLLSGDVTAPILATPTIAPGITTAVATVDSDTAEGTLYWVVTQSGTKPSVPQIQAGQDHLGGSPDASGNQAVTTTAPFDVTITGLVSDITYYYHHQQDDAAGNDSTVVSSASFVLTMGAATQNIFGRDDSRRYFGPDRRHRYQGED